MWDPRKWSLLPQQGEGASAVWPASSTFSALQLASFSSSPSPPQELVVVVAAGRGRLGRVARFHLRVITAAVLPRAVAVVALGSRSLLPQQGEGASAVWPASSISPCYS